MTKQRGHFHLEIRERPLQRNKRHQHKRQALRNLYLRFKKGTIGIQDERGFTKGRVSSGKVKETPLEEMNVV